MMKKVSTMRQDKLRLSEHNSAEVEVLAGEFSNWLWRMTGPYRASGAEVPCGSCAGCCRSSMFILIRPGETQALQRIPKNLLFSAPGMPQGYMIMGYNKRGECPMLENGKCSIYKDRPQTCRDYDCRIFAATGLKPDLEIQPEIGERVDQWRFNHADEESLKLMAAIREGAAFLKMNASLFPEGALPRNPAQMANLALRIYHLFEEGAEQATAENIADLILEEIQALKAKSSV